MPVAKSAGIVASGGEHVRQLITRDRQIAELAEWFGTDPKLWRRFDQDALDTAWLVAVARWC